MSWVALLTVAAIALALRLYALGGESLWMDELSQVRTYHLPLSYVVTEATNLPQPPLDCLIGAGLDRLHLADSDWWVRLPPALFGVGAVVLLGWWVARIGGAVAGLTAAVLLAICPLHVAMSQEARPYTSVFFFALASVLAFARARREHTVLSWCLFWAVFLCLLMTRLVEPHFITLGLAGYALGVWVMSVFGGDTPRRREETSRLWASFTAMVSAYAISNTVLGLMFDAQRRSVAGSEVIDWTARLVDSLWGAFQAILAGYSARTVFSALPGNRWILIFAAVLVAAGLSLLLLKVLRRRDPLVTLFLITIVPFPIAFGAVYARFATPTPKPQYLLLMAAPLFACIALAVDSVRRSLLPVSRRASAILFAGMIAAIAVPMGYASGRSLAAQDKRDWRGVMTYLRDHAGADDAFAGVAANSVPPLFSARVYGQRRYGPDGVKFLPVDFRAMPQALDAEPWSGVGNTVWMVVYRDRFYTGSDQIPAPSNPPTNMAVHEFNGLFIVEVNGEGSSAKRLMDGFALLYRDLPDAGNLVAPALLKGRYLLARGDHVAAQAQFDAALRQCGSEEETRIFKEDYLPDLRRSETELSVAKYPLLDAAGSPVYP